MSDSQRNPWNLNLIQIVEDNVDFMTRFKWVSLLILISKKCTSHFRRETTKVKYTVLRYKDMNILFILDQTKLSRFTLKNRHCAPSLHEGLLKITLRVPLIGLYSAIQLRRIFELNFQYFGKKLICSALFVS